jgi:O-succinylbenzoic acid--CoA ligase
VERADLARLLGAPSRPGRVPVAVAESDPAVFMSAFARAVATGGNVFLADPAWRATERFELVRHLEGARADERGWLMIPSGGSGGVVKFARHDGSTIAAAVAGFSAHFDLPRVNSVGILPLHHVSGFMAWMRSLLTGGTYVPWSWKELESGRFPAQTPPGCCLSLVPTQLQRLLGSSGAVEWLRKFRVIFIGGAPAWDGLLDQARRLGLPLSACYGATETAAMATAQKPEQFLAGQRGCGAPLPHVRIEIVAGGVVRVSAESLFRGYFPASSSERSWTTGDLGSLDDGGNLVILGRRDDLILTGGEKVTPAEVEAALRSSGEFEDVAVVGLPDPEWGQKVVACYPAMARAPDTERLRAALAGLAPFKHPKSYVGVTPWPRSAQGKINRAELARLAAR